MNICKHDSYPSLRFFIRCQFTSSDGDRLYATTHSNVELPKVIFVSVRDVRGGDKPQRLWILIGAGAGGVAGYELKDEGYEVQSPVKKEGRTHTR
jgi:hypothetical protein